MDFLELKITGVVLVILPLPPSLQTFNNDSTRLWECVQQKLIF